MRTYRENKEMDMKRKWIMVMMNCIGVLGSG